MTEQELQKLREKKYLQLIDLLNKKRQQGARIIFNCGKLGFALVHWDRYGWNVEWFEPVSAKMFLAKTKRR